MKDDAALEFYEVITPFHPGKVFTYSSLPGQGVEIGSVVVVPFGAQTTKGVVIDRLSQPPSGVNVKKLQLLSSDMSALPEGLLQALQVTADYFFVPLGTLLKTALPPGFLKKSTFRYRIRSERLPMFLTDEELKVVSYIGERERTSHALRSAFPGESIMAILKRLMELGVITRVMDVSDRQIESVKRRAVALRRIPSEEDIQKLDVRAPRQAAVLRLMMAEKTEPFHLCIELVQQLGCGYDVFRSLEKKEYVRTFSDFQSLVSGDRHYMEQFRLTAGQKAFLASFKARPRDVHLLYGVTGSGKTECYLQCADDVMASGKRVLYLVPEIGLTPAAISRLKIRFGRHIAILHSGLSGGERLSEWLRILNDRVGIVVGTRSAVFAPISNIGLIIIDEENDMSYKQSSHPRYNAVHAALIRGQVEGAGVILGSATPTMESYRHGLDGKYQLSELPERVNEGGHPEISLVDMREEFLRSGGKKSMLSKSLLTEMRNALKQKGQIMLFLNRRGFAPFLLCRKCGRVEQCPHCSVTLTVHAGHSGKPLRCHYCGTEKEMPHVCPGCGDSFIQMMGFGTQRIEQRVKAAFPKAKVFRADRDTMKGKKAFQDLHEKMLSGDIDILIGTQMIARGHHFPGVGLVGIVDADSGLKFPDFRATERAFSLLLQASGRAGRGHAAGKVMIQTYQPDNTVFEYLSRADFTGFAEAELRFRERSGYPPFSHMIAVEVKGSEESRVTEIAGRIANRLSHNQIPGVMILGPFQAGLYRIKSLYRQLLLIRGPSRKAVRMAFSKGVLPIYQNNRMDYQVTITPDIDPLWID